MTVMDMFNLDGKVALVTGGYGLYGSQITEALVEAGATVITASRSLDKNEACAAKMRERGLKVYAESYDMADEDSMTCKATIFELTGAQLGSYEVL